MSPIASVQDRVLQAAADAAASQVPATSPLVAVPAPAGATPPPTAQAVVASLVGSTSAELAVIAADVVVEAVAAGSAAGAPISLADALRPALEAAAAALGAGVLGEARTEPVAHVVGADTQVFVLRAGDEDVAWFTVRVRSAQLSGTAAPAQRASMRVLYDVEMTLTAELGRTRLPLRQVLELAPGAVLELDRTAGSPADVMVNGRLIARGEVVVVDEDYGLRITEIIAGPEQAL